MRGHKLFFILALFLGSALSGYAKNKDVVDLGQIVVTPSGVEENSVNSTRNVDIISGGGEGSNNLRDLGEPLTRETSVNVSNYGGLGATQNIRLRGSTAAQVLVMVDGRPVNNPRDGAVDLNTLPLDNISRVELVPGPASSLYGSQAMAGTLNIITKDPPRDKMETELYSSFGTFRTYKENISNGARIGNFGYRVNGGWERTAGFRRNGAYKAENYENKFTYKLNEQNDLSLNAGFFNGQSGTPGLISAPDIDDTQRNLTHFVDAAWKYRPDALTTISLRGYNNYDRLEFRENTAGSIFDVPFSEAVHTTRWRGLNLQADRQFCDLYQLVAGLNYVENFNDSNSSGKHSYRVKAAYLENNLELFEKLKLTLAARVDDYSNFGSQLNPSFSFLYRFNEGFRVRGLLARSFRAPTFNDLYWPDEGWAKGNPDLKPEKGMTGELGFDNKFGKYFSLGMTYYHNNFTNLIQWAPDSSGSVWQPSNVGRAVINGVETQGKVFITEQLEASLGYTYLRAIDDKAHTFLIYQPQNKYDAGLQYKTTGGFTAKLNCQLYGSRFHDAANTIKVKRFFTMGLDAAKEFKHGITAFFNIDNFLNEKYQVIRDYPMPGFAFTGGIKVKF